MAAFFARSCNINAPCPIGHIIGARHSWMRWQGKHLAIKECAQWRAFDKIEMGVCVWALCHLAMHKIFEKRILLGSTLPGQSWVPSTG